jgi:hypothetical protein
MFDDLPDLWELIASPRPAVTTSLGSLSTIDLQMMHQWSTFTGKTTAIGPESSNVLLFNIPQLAFENDYLLQCILGISSLHLEHMSPDKKYNKKQTSKYREKALLGFRQAIAKADFQPLNWEAALINSILLLALCSKDNVNGIDRQSSLTVINWVVLYRGLSAIIMMRSFDNVANTSLKPIFRREWRELRFAPVIPRNLVTLLEGVTPLDSDFAYLESYCNVLDSMGILYGSLTQDGVAPELWIRVISWPSYLSQDFANCAVEQRPRALIILAHYLCFIKLIKGLWWVDDIPDTEIPAIMSLIGDHWLPFMTVPLAASQESDKEEIARMLLLGGVASRQSSVETEAYMTGPITTSTALEVLSQANCSTDVLYPFTDKGL